MIYRKSAFFPAAVYFLYTNVQFFLKENGSNNITILKFSGMYSSFTCPVFIIFRP